MGHLMSWQPAVSSTRYAWAVVAMLWPVAVLNYLDRQMLSTMGLSIKVDIVELQSAQNFGRLMAIFLWVYAFCSPMGGAIADRVNRKWLIVASLGVWSTVTLLMGQAANFHQLYVLRGIMGVSEALYMPAGLALIADYHRGPTRSLAVGAHLSGVYMGQALGGIGGWVAQEVSWRAAFVSCGAIGVAYALVLMLFLRETDRGTAEKTTGTSAPGEVVEPGVNWRGFVILLFCFSLPSLSGWAVKNWLPTLLQDRFGMAQAPSGLWATITHAGAGFCGVILGGGLADRWSNRSVRGRTYVSTLGLALLVPTIVIVGLAPGFPLAIAGAALFGLGFGMFDANNMPILCQVAPGRLRATGYGVMNFCGIASGAYLTPVLGKLKDSGVPLATGFAYCAIPALFAAVLMFLLRPTNRDRGVAN
jgi:ACS family D-galactonate transporter-like MFS transporter